MTYLYIKDNHYIRLNQIMTTRLGSYIYKRLLVLLLGIFHWFYTNTNIPTYQESKSEKNLILCLVFNPQQEV